MGARISEVGAVLWPCGGCSLAQSVLYVVVESKRARNECQRQKEGCLQPARPARAARAGAAWGTQHLATQSITAAARRAASARRLSPGELTTRSTAWSSVRERQQGCICVAAACTALTGSADESHFRCEGGGGVMAGQGKENTGGGRARACATWGGELNQGGSCPWLPKCQEGGEKSAVRRAE